MQSFPPLPTVAGKENAIAGPSRPHLYSTLPFRPQAKPNPPQPAPTQPTTRVYSTFQPIMSLHQANNPTLEEAQRAVQRAHTSGPNNGPNTVWIQNVRTMVRIAHSKTRDGVPLTEAQSWLLANWTVPQGIAKSKDVARSLLKIPPRRRIRQMGTGPQSQPEAMPTLGVTTVGPTPALTKLGVEQTPQTVRPPSPEPVTAPLVNVPVAVPGTVTALTSEPEPGEIEVDEGGYFRGAPPLLEPSRPARDYITPLASSSLGAGGYRNHPWYDGSEEEILEECNKLRHTRTYVRGIHPNGFVDDFEPDLVKVVARKNLTRGLPSKGKVRKAFIAYAMALLVTRGAYRIALEREGHKDLNPTAVRVEYKMGDRGVTLSSIVAHLALLGVTPEMASQWDSYVYDWCREYTEQLNLPHKDDIEAALKEREKAPVNGNYTILECLVQRRPSIKEDGADTTEYHFPGPGRKGHGTYEEREDISDLFPDLPNGMQPYRPAPPPYDSGVAMDQS